MTEQQFHTEEAAIDTTVISELREIEEGLIDELIELFLEDSPQRVEAIREAITKGDPRELSLAAHALKGSCSNMGAKPMSKICLQLETLGKAGSLENADKLLVKLEAEYDRVQSILSAEKKNSG